jgi:hypothetical protein
MWGPNQIMILISRMIGEGLLKDVWHISIRYVPLRGATIKSLCIAYLYKLRAKLIIISLANSNQTFKR